MKPVIAIYPGTFDPITRGHEDIVRRAAQLFDQVVVAVAVAHHKKTLFSLDERLRMVADALSDCAVVRVLPFEGLIMDFCRQQGACAVVRGIRNVADFDYEAQMAAMNRKLAAHQQHPGARDQQARRRCVGPGVGAGAAGAGAAARLRRVLRPRPPPPESADAAGPATRRLRAGTPGGRGRAGVRCG